MKRALESLAAQFDQPSDINKLPARTLMQALAHPDHVAVVTLTDSLVELPGMDLATGYTLFDNDFYLLYTENTASGLVHIAWGTRPKDSVWVHTNELGAYAYLTFADTSGEDRIVMLVRG